jgi:hypothetical protein
MSSMRSRKMPPRAFAKRQLSMADLACPTWSRPFGLGGESDNRLGHVWFRVGVVFGHDISWHFSQAPSPGLM